MEQYQKPKPTWDQKESKGVITAAAQQLPRTPAAFV